MKRERLNTAEVEMNNGALDINIWNMLKNRQSAVELINEKFGTEITVNLNYSVFNESNGNANENEEESEGVQDEEVPIEVAQSDPEAQIDGVQEDEAEDTARDSEDKNEDDSGEKEKGGDEE